MGRRRRVPAGLRSELSEYSSLLRVLNVSGTLDVTSHLTESHPPTSTSEDDSVQSRDESGDEEMKDLLNDAIPPLSSEFDPDPDHVAGFGMNTRGKSKRTAKERSRTTRVQDTWRWPLLAADVYVPEWGLEDEIKVIATDILKQHSSPPASQHKPGPIQPDERDDQMFDGDDDDDILPMPFADALTLATSAQLSRILAAVVSHVPLSENSMQNRALPIGWLGVLNIVGASELFDEKSV